MKSIKILLAALLAMAFVGTASATTTTIHICGSTAYRAPVTAAIISILKPGYVCAYDSSSSSSATAIYGSSAAIFSGTLASDSGVVIIKTFWTGSLAGVTDLVTQNPLQGKFIPSSVTMTAGTGNNVHGAYTGENGTCDVAMSDSFSTSVAASISGASVSPSIVVGAHTYSSGAQIAAAINSAALQVGGSQGETVVGVVPFVWETGHLSSGTPPFTNMTQQVALALVNTGNVPLSMLTTSVNDLSNYLMLVGRNEDSGTRIGALAEAQQGFGNAPSQYQITFTNNQTTGTGLNTGGAGSTIASLALWPANSPLNTEPNINWNTSGHSGYVAGGDVSNVLASTNNQTFTFTANTPDAWSQGSSTGYLVGYVGLADALGSTGTLVAPANGGTLLTYNGVAFNVAAIQDGAYSFWTFEHMYYLATSGDIKQTANDVADAVYNTYAPTNSAGVTQTAVNQANQPNSAGIIYDDLVTFYFTRSQEGGVVNPNY